MAFFRWEKLEQEPDPEGIGEQPRFPLTDCPLPSVVLLEKDLGFLARPGLMGP